MIAWMAARCDEPNYGKLVVYNFPKQRLVYGPSQIVSRINQDARFLSNCHFGTVAAQKFFGKFIGNPVQNSILYIQPLYLASSRKQFAGTQAHHCRLRNNIAMEETLDLSLGASLAGRPGDRCFDSGPTAESAAGGALVEGPD